MQQWQQQKTKKHYHQQYPWTKVQNMLVVSSNTIHAQFLNFDYFAAVLVGRTNFNVNSTRCTAQQFQTVSDQYEQTNEKKIARTFTILLIAAVQMFILHSSIQAIPRINDLSYKQ